MVVTPQHGYHVRLCVFAVSVVVFEVVDGVVLAIFVFYNVLVQPVNCLDEIAI